MRPGLSLFFLATHPTSMVSRGRDCPKGQKRLKLKYVQQVHLKYKPTKKMKENGRRKMYHANNKLAKAGVAIISTKVYFKTKTIPRDKDRYLIIINGSIHQEDNNSYNNNRASKYTEQKWTELKEETDDSTITVRDFKLSSAIDTIYQKKNQ